MSYVRKEIIGDCVLYQGDCMDILPTLGKVDAKDGWAILTDPPYGISYSPGGGVGRGGIKDKNGKRYKKTFTGKDIVIGDNTPFDPKPLLDLKLPTILWGGNHYASRLPDSSAWFVWDKKCGLCPTDFADCEIAWSNLGKAARCLPHMWNGMIRQSERGVRYHPTQKPIKVMEWCISHLPDTAQTILDPFMGSATTLVACAKMGRKGIGIELDPDYFEIACKRVEDAYRQPDLLIQAEKKDEPKQETLIL